MTGRCGRDDGGTAPFACACVPTQRPEATSPPHEKAAAPVFRDGRLSATGVGA